MSGTLQGKVSVVTGAGSGIGQAIALELAGRGALVALSDVNADTVAETAARCERLGAATHHQSLDVSDRDAVETYAAIVADYFGSVHHVYNNAGVATSGFVTESSYEDYERILNVNLWGVIHGTKAFLPHLIASGEGHLVNLSSLNGFQAQPKLSHYCTSKFAVRGFTEAVRADMLTLGHPVKVTCVHPGGVKTNIAAAARAAAAQRNATDPAAVAAGANEKLLRMDPAQAARIIVSGACAGKPRVLVGNDAKVVDALSRLLPARAVLGAVFLDRRLGGQARAATTSGGAA